MSLPAEGFPTLALIEARVRAAVESVAATDPNPTDPFRGLYVTDELAVAIARSGPLLDPDARLAQAAERLGLDALDAAVLAVCAAPELNPAYGRLYAYLHDDVTRKLPSPGLVARLVSGEGLPPGEVLARFGRDAPLRRLGALRLIDERGQTPIADRAVKVADPVAALLLGAELDEIARDGRLRREEVPAADPGGPAALVELRARLGAGPDAPALLAAALGRPLLIVDAADSGDADLMRESRLAAALEGRRRCFDGFEGLDPGTRRAAVRTLGAVDERALICALTPDAAVALGDRAALVVEVPLPTYGERRAAWAAEAGTEEVDDVAAKFRLSLTQIADAAEVARQTAAIEGEPAPLPRHLDMGARRAAASGSWPRGSSRPSGGSSSCCPSGRSRCCTRSRPTCAIATWCSPSGATPAPWRAPRASRRSSPASRAPARRWRPRCWPATSAWSSSASTWRR
jgi:hypothetical protein